MIHETAQVSSEAKIGEGTKIWNHAQVREKAEIGKNCIISKNVYVDFGVKIGDNTKIQNNVSVYHGVTLENGVFVGPHVCFTNDKLPRAINPDGTPKSAEDWMLSKTLVKSGASIGAHSVIICGTTIGKFALVGAGAVVTKNIPDHGLAIGMPAKLMGFVCHCCNKLVLEKKEKETAQMKCPKCNSIIKIPIADYEMIKIK